MKRLNFFVILFLLALPLAQGEGESGAADKPVTLVVDQSGKGDYESITKALATANAGDTLLVKNGFYQEEIVFTKGVTVKPESSGGVRIESEKPIQFLNCQNARLEGISISGNKFGININQSKKIIVRNCHISSDKEISVNIEKSSDVLISGCSLSGKEKTNGLVLRNSQAEIRENIFFGYDNAISVSESSKVEVVKNLLEGNQVAVKIINSAFNLKENTITGTGKWSGVFLQNSKGHTLGNFIRRFNAGLEAMTVDGEAAENTISQNNYGIIFRSGSLTVSENIILSNRYYGIVLNGEGVALDQPKRAIITRNTVTGNGASGISVWKFKADISYNIVEANTGGILIGESEVNILNNTLVMQKLSGLEIGRNSQASIFNNIVAYNTFGICQDISSQTKRGYNDVCWNLISKKFPLVDGNYVRRDRLSTRSGEKIHVSVSPAYDLKDSTDFSEEPMFVKLGSDYRLAKDSPLAKRKGKDGAFIGALPAAP